MTTDYDELNLDADSGEKQTPQTEGSDSEFEFVEVEAEEAEAKEVPEKAAVPVNLKETDNKETATVAAKKVEKKPWSRKKKIIVITVSAVLAFLLTLAGAGTALFYHYYNKMNIQGRDQIDADERVLRLFDPESGSRYTFTINLIGLPDADTELIDTWFIGNKELIISVPKRPIEMTESESAEFLQVILEELRRLKNPSEIALPVIKVHNMVDGKDWDLKIESEFVAEASDYGDILEYITVQNQGSERLQIYFPTDFSALNDAQKKAVYAEIAKEIRNLKKVRYPISLLDVSADKSHLFVIYHDELTEEQAKLLLNFSGTLALRTLPENMYTMSSQERVRLIEHIGKVLADLAIPRYTIRIRDPLSNTMYDFAIKKTELTDSQLILIVKQINRGVLDVAVDIDPNLLDAEQKQLLIEEIVAAIDLLEHPPKQYQILLKDRVSGKTYTVTFEEEDVNDADLIELLSAIQNNSTVLLSVPSDPSAMDKDALKALLARAADELRYPSRALLLEDSTTGKKYTLYFRDQDVSAELLNLMIKQIESGNALKVQIQKDPSTMSLAELTALYEAISVELKREPVVEYRIVVRDTENGMAYNLVFTKEEVNDATVWGYLLEQVQRGGVLDVPVYDDPAKMTPSERQSLFSAAAEAVRQKLIEEDDPELLDKMMEHLNNIAKNPAQHVQDIYNVLLVGTDERRENNPEIAKNSDTMILVTLNYKDKTITMTSLMRDTCVKYTYMSGGKERENVARLNTAYAIGGIKTLISAIESNYGVKIDNYVKVNWYSFLDVFKALGDIKIDVKDNKDAEKNDLVTLNKVIKEQCDLFGYDYETNKITSYGEQYLNPNQLLAFARYRTTTADFGRTERQRQLLAAVFEKFKSSSLLKMNEVVETVLPMLTTDLSEENCASLLLKFPSIAGFKLQQFRFPGSGDYGSYDGMLMPDWPVALKKMYAMAYGSLCPEQYK